MKKILIYLVALIVVSCENYTTKYWGCTMTINIEPGYKVTNATFKEDEIWYFVEPMDEIYTPKQKKFIEKSMFGAFEGEIVFIEKR